MCRLCWEVRAPQSPQKRSQPVHNLAAAQSLAGAGRRCSELQVAVYASPENGCTPRSWQQVLIAAEQRGRQRGQTPGADPASLRLREQLWGSAPSGQCLFGGSCQHGSLGTDLGVEGPLWALAS